MKWYKHPGNSINTAEIEKLIMKYGLEGYGLYWVCVEMIAGALNAENPTFELRHDAEILAHKFNIDTIKVENIMKYCIELGLFEMDITTKRIYCFALLKMLDVSTSNNPEIKKIKNSTNYQKLLDSNSRLDKIRLDKIREDKTKEKECSQKMETPLTPENQPTSSTPEVIVQLENEQIVPNKSKKSSSKLSNDELDLLEFWNKCPHLQTHKVETVKLYLQKKHRDILKVYTPIDITHAILNYDKYREKPELYLWTSNWSLAEFIVRGLHRFTNEADPLRTFRKDKGEVKKKLTTDERQAYWKRISDESKAAKEQKKQS